MRRLLLLPLLALASAGIAAPDDGTVKSEEFNFEISMPDSIDWEKVALGENKAIKAHFRTDFVDSDPPAFAEVQLLAVPLRKEYATMKIENVAKQWAATMESALGNPRELKEEPAKLGGQDAFMRDVKGDYISGLGHVTWYLSRNGEFLYVLYAIRVFSAVDDEDVESEIKEIRDSFKYLRIVEVKASKKGGKEGAPAGPAGAGQGKGAEEVDPDKVKREKVENDYWRFECMKPEGLFNTDPEAFTQSEKDNNMVAKFSRSADQTTIMIRIFAQAENVQRYTIQQLAERNLKSWETTYGEKQRLEPEIDNGYKKFPMAKEAIYMKLVGRRLVPETTLWYLAQCKNERQYQIQIYITGTTGEKQWEEQIKDFVKSFKPSKK